MFTHPPPPLPPYRHTFTDVWEYVWSPLLLVDCFFPYSRFLGWILPGFSQVVDKPHGGLCSEFGA